MQVKAPTGANNNGANTTPEQELEPEITNELATERGTAETLDTTPANEQPPSFQSKILGHLFLGTLPTHSQNKHNAVYVMRDFSSIDPFHSQTRNLPPIWQNIIYCIPVLNSLVATSQLICMLVTKSDEQYIANPFWWRLFFEATDIRLSAISIFYHLSTLCYTRPPSDDKQDLSFLTTAGNIASHAFHAIFEILLFICVDANRAVNTWEHRTEMLKNNPQICFFLRVIGVILNIASTILLACANPLIAGHAIGSNVMHLPTVIQTISSGVYHSSANLFNHALGVAKVFYQLVEYALATNTLTTLPNLILSMHASWNGADENQATRMQHN